MENQNMSASIRKPLPPEHFIVHGTSAETRWEALRGHGEITPNELFFVRNHTTTPLIDVDTWRLRLWGTGLRRVTEYGYRDLLAMPSETLTAFIECAGNGRRLFTEQQGQPVHGISWRLGAVGVARWRGVRLATLLERSGLKPEAVAVMATGLDADYIEDGVNHGRVRRPLPLAKAMDDVLVAYEMNGRPLPPDHGFPARLVVPGWVGIASIKWLGDIEVSTEPLSSPWTTRFYRTAAGEPLREVVVKSAFELEWGARLETGRTHVLHGRSWSGHGAVTRVEFSADLGATWHPVSLIGRPSAHGWARWTVSWTPTIRGEHRLLARATDASGAVQPSHTPSDGTGYQFGAVAHHPVTLV